MKKLRVATVFLTESAKHKSEGFAGAEWALKYANISHEVVFACEIDKFARKLYGANHECVTFYKYATKLDAKPYRGKIDLTIGGFPCQAFSIAGKRRGFEDTRGTMFYELARVISEVQPRYFIAENVKGLLSHDYGRTYKRVCETLRELGYHIACKVLNSTDFGTPQNRERIFIVGFRDVEEYHAFEFLQPFKLTNCLADVLQTQVDEKYFLSDKLVKGFMSHRDRHKKRGNGFSFEPKTKDDIATCISTRYGTRATDTYLIQIGNIDKKGHNSSGAGAKTGLYKVNERIRKLTPRECFRLMGDTQDRVRFADLSDTQLYKNAGDGMDINVVRAIIEKVKK